MMIENRAAASMDLSQESCHGLLTRRGLSHATSRADLLAFPCLIIIIIIVILLLLLLLLIIIIIIDI